MVRVIALYRVPADDAFQARYAEHEALCRKVPGLQAFRFGKVLGTPGGPSDMTWYAEFEFADRDAFKAAARSPEFAATGADVAEFAPGTEVLFVDIDG